MKDHYVIGRLIAWGDNTPIPEFVKIRLFIELRYYKSNKYFGRSKKPLDLWSLIAPIPK